MDNNGLSASDVALLSRDPYGYGYRANNACGDGWGGFMWIFALLILAGGGFGGFGNNNWMAGNIATQNDVQRGFDNQNTIANQREILAATTAGTSQAVAATNQTFHDTISVLGDKYNELQRDIAGLAVGQANSLANQNECCCNTRMAIADVGARLDAGIAQTRYDNALNTAAINANTTAQTQKILDTISANKIEALQDKVHALELQNAVSGVVRYPSALTYNAGASPFCNPGCGCGM